MSMIELSQSEAESGFLSHSLQALVLAPEPGCEALYWRQIDAEGAVVPATDPTSIAPGCRLRLDTLLNSFFERYWCDLTELATLELIVETSGACNIKILRRWADQPERVIGFASARGQRVHTRLPIELSDLSVERSILHAEIQALEETAALHAGAWRTNDTARNEVRLAIVICSFGREAMVIDSLRRMASIVARTPEIATVLIVHQGARDLARSPAYERLVSEISFGKKLRLVQQGNFGGTGGFTRGILESLEADATHVLLLDDDVRIEPAVLERLKSLATRLKDPTTIGGQMLNLHQPTMLHASHELVNYGSLRLSNPCKDMDLSAANAVDLFGRRHDSDYNAWWFCCVPASTFRAIGLPMPMFIRLDDVEYGVRTVRSGGAVVTMPGIFVWHEPFSYENARPSLVYYGRRNFMITAALHKQANAFRFFRRHWKDTWSSLRKHRYDYCWALCRAVEDFLRGPASNFTAIDARHRQLVADQQRLTLMTMASLRHHMACANGASGPRPPSLLGLFARRPNVASAADAKFAAMTQELASAIVRTSLALLLRTHRVAAAYRVEAPTYSSPAFWRRLLALPRPERSA